MKPDNTQVIKRELIAEIARLFFQGSIKEEIDRLPVLRFPKTASSYRCCIYRDRAITRYRIMALLGIEIEKETDELTPLLHYLEEALSRTTVTAPVLTMIDEACTACIKAKYLVTDACRGCVARPCQTGCPKDAVNFVKGQAWINPDKCVNCGICQKRCPYHAIIYTPIPCEEACPVDALSKEANGREKLDYEKCISCGKCMKACPFGAIMERSQIIDVLNHLVNKKSKMIVLLAPAVLGQFREDEPLLRGAIKTLGFARIASVTEGALQTTIHEAAELEEKLQRGEMLTTSCCPGYTQTVKRHLKGLSPYVSHALTPLQYSAAQAKRDYPDHLTVFISPCTAKRMEGIESENIDYVLTIEELGSLFVGAGIDINECAPDSETTAHPVEGLHFPVCGGVSASVLSHLKNSEGVKTAVVDGIDKKNLLRLKAMASGKTGDAFVEVMACEGGCVNGPCVIRNAPLTAAKLKQIEGQQQKP